MKTMGELMDEYEAERLAQIDADEARRNTPEAIARSAAKKAEEHERGVRLGWWTADGEPIPSDDSEDDDDEAAEYDDGRDFSGRYEP